MKKYIETFVTLIASALMPIQAILLLVGICIILDTIFGIFKSYKNNIPITSRNLGHVISKMFLYEFVVIMFYSIDTILLNDLMKSVFPIDLLLTKLTGTVMIMVETISILENIKLATGYDFIQMAKDAMKRGKSIKNQLNEIKD